MLLQKNMTMVDEQLEKPAKEIELDKMREIFEKARKLLYGIGSHWSKN